MALSSCSYCSIPLPADEQQMGLPSSTEFWQTRDPSCIPLISRLLCRTPLSLSLSAPAPISGLRVVTIFSTFQSLLSREVHPVWEERYWFLHMLLWFLRCVSLFVTQIRLYNGKLLKGRVRFSVFFALPRWVNSMPFINFCLCGFKIILFVHLCIFLYVLTCE